MLCSVTVLKVLSAVYMPHCGIVATIPGLFVGQMICLTSTACDSFTSKQKEETICVWQLRSTWMVCLISCLRSWGMSERCAMSLMRVRGVLAVNSALKDGSLQAQNLLNRDCI